MTPNRFPGRCLTCRLYLAIGDGAIVKTTNNWETYCLEHVPPKRTNHMTTEQFDWGKIHTIECCGTRWAIKCRIVSDAKTIKYEHAKCPRCQKKFAMVRCDIGTPQCSEVT